MKKEQKKKEDQLTNNILTFTENFLKRNNSNLINRRKFYRLFLDEYPLLYQRKDKITISYENFYNKVIKVGICSRWKLRRKKNKLFKLDKKNIDYAYWK